MAEAAVPPAPVAVPPPAPAAAPAPVAAAPVVEPIKPAAPPAAVPAAEPVKPAAAAPEVKPPAPDAKPDAAKPATPAAVIEFELKLPEGAKYDAEALGEFKALAKEEGITAKQAEKLFILDQKFAKANAAKAADAIRKQAEEARAADEKVLKADAEFSGKDGAQYDQSVVKARSAMKQLFGEEGSKLLEAVGYDKHPVFAKGLKWFRERIAEDDTGSRAPSSGAVPKTPSLTPPTQTGRLAGVYSDPKVAVKKK